MKNQTFTLLGRLFLLSLFLFQFNFIHGQTCSGDITLSTQAEVDAFDCINFDGKLSVSGQDITNISALSSLQSVLGHFLIYDCPNIENLHGLENLVSIDGQIALVNLPLIENLDQLEKLNMFSSFVVQGDSSLTNINGILQFPSTLESIFISNNSEITNIDVISTVTSLQQLEINRNPNLENINGLQNLTQITDYGLTLIYNPKVTSYMPLSNLKEVPSDLVLLQNGPTDLKGLEALDSVGAFFILEHNNLTSLNGLSDHFSAKGLIIDANHLLTNISALDGNDNFNPIEITLSRNTNLTDCCSLYHTLKRNPTLDFSALGNGAMCNTRNEIVNACAPPCEKDTELTTQAEVDAFDCIHFEGQLSVSGQDIVNINALSSLKTITGSLTIYDTGLTNLNGLENLTEISKINYGASIAIVLNSKLENFEGISNLSNVEQLIILGNPLIENLDEFTSIPSYLSHFLLQSNDNIKNIDVLSRVTSIDDIEITNNFNLESINGFQNLEKISSLFLFSEAPKITSLEALSNVTVAGNIVPSNTGISDLTGIGNILELQGLFVGGNPNLTSLNGLNSKVSIINQISVSQCPLLTDISILADNENLNPDRLFFSDNPLLTDCCSLYPSIVRNPDMFVDVHDNGDMCGSKQDIINACKPPTNIDLELSMTISQNNPDVYSFFTQTVTVTNTGNEVVRELNIENKLVDGAVLEGGNEYDLTRGLFDPYSGYWYIGALNAGESETLEIHYFNLSEDDKIFWSQIESTSTNEDDDSTPGNGVYPDVNEDDEAVINSGEAVNLPDLTLSNLASTGIGNPGDEIEYTFDLNNIGTVESDGDYTISGYFSIDNVFSNDDVWVGSVFTGNTPKGTIEDVTASLTIPITLPVGNYQFILVADIDQEVVEQKEENNMTSIPFVVSDGGLESCMGDVILTTQAEVDAFNCSSIDGDLMINGSDITSLGALITLESITGELRIQNTELVSLSGLNNLTSVQSLILTFNSSLESIEQLMKLTGEIRTLVVTDNDKLERIDVVKQMIVQNDIHIVGNDRLMSIEGLINTVGLDILEILGNARLKSLAGLDHLSIINTIHLMNNGLLQNLNGLNNLTQVTDQFLLQGNGIKDLQGLGGLRVVDIFVISGNWNLTNLNALSGFVASDEAFVVRDNIKLNNFCGLYNFFKDGSFADVVILENLENPDIPTILSDCAPSENGSDLSLTMEIDAPSTPLWDFFKVTITLSNTGTEDASNVKVHIPVPDGAVLEGGNEYQTPLGIYDTWNTFEWSLYELQAGQSIAIELNYFRLGANAVKFYAEVASNETLDTDSTPGNGTPPNPNEDDEIVASLDVVAEGLIGSQPDYVLSDNGKILLELVLANEEIDTFGSVALYPNPTTDKLFLSLDVKESVSANISIYNLSGQKLSTQFIDFHEGSNIESIDINGLEHGIYEMMITTSEFNKVLKFIKM